jgi:hypothetical protein
MINENIADFAYLQSPFFSSSTSSFSKASFCSCFNFIIYCFASEYPRGQIYRSTISLEAPPHPLPHGAGRGGG